MSSFRYFKPNINMPVVMKAAAHIFAAWGTWNMIQAKTIVKMAVDTMAKMAMNAFSERK
jgi:hypothetical protein